MTYDETHEPEERHKNNMTEYLEAADVVSLVPGVRTTDTVRAWADRGKLPVHARTPRGLRLFLRSDVVALAESLARGAA